MTAPTPLRNLDRDLLDGVRMLVDHSTDWRDGGEEEIIAVCERVSDRSVLSEELPHFEHSWETTYHLSPDRANVLRGLDLPADAAVLEVGAGCGAVTRFIGESVGLVDALEPDLLRAKAAASRCSDLPGVEVFCGPVFGIPTGPAYDVIVVVGVLEYVGARDGHAERVAWLSHLAQCLKPGGSVVCAIENRLGVQYLVGAPEEHVAQPFAGVEDYPAQGPVRTFDRRALTGLFAEAGFQTEVKHVFPDYKFARVVFGDALLEGSTADLGWRLPVFPSAASPHPRARLASEARVWRGLVEAGLGSEFANSFLVVATTEADARPVWPAQQLAVFWGNRRKPRFATETRVVAEGGDAVFERRRLSDAPSLADESLTLNPQARARFLPHRSILELLEDAGEPETTRLLGVWRTAVEKACEMRPFNIDAGPQHVLLGDDGEAVVIDVEWFDASYSVEDVLARGLLTAAMSLVDTCPPGRWPAELVTVADLLDYLAGHAGLPVVHADAVHREAQLLAATVRTDSPEGAGLAGWESAVNAAVARPLADGALGARDMVQAGDWTMPALHEKAAELHATIVDLHAEVALRDAEVERLRAALEPQ